ncbi:hypothetical protein AX17_004993 [Amanita inopinata Kibby_2008]|nr:hypothetical protein AX17_004993 [Amanita inopinata Kibby_2008]
MASSVSAADHRHARSFFGPMPHALLCRVAAQDTNSTLGRCSDDDIAGLIERHAFRFFLHEGGRKEDWHGHEKLKIKQKMLNRWRKSEWGVILSNLPRAQHADRWVGNSFEIGNFLGLDLNTPLGVSEHTEPSGAEECSSHEAVPWPPQGFHHSSPISAQVEHVGPVTSNEALESSASDAPHSLTPSIESNLESSGRKGSVGQNAAVPATDTSVRSIEHAEAETPGSISMPEASNGARTSLHEIPSAGNSTAPLLREVETEHVLLRDRMLVRVYHSKSDMFHQRFDEGFHRISQDLHYKAWAEFLVVLRGGRIELYEEHDFPGKEWLIGHKYLSFVIPLSTKTTRLSLYSFVDLTFCLTCPPASTRKDALRSPWTFLFERGGTNIFIFKIRSRSRAYDWMWRLWRLLGGCVPESIKIRNPLLDATVSIDVPDADTDNMDGTFHIFSRKNVVDLCMKSLSSVPEWDSLIQREVQAGGSLELAWRMGTNLDWIWLDTDVQGESRKLAVLCGLATRVALKPATLEIRLAGHYPTRIHLKDGERVDEPPGVEGYLKHIRPNAALHFHLYLSTHDGNLFFLPLHCAHPPSPPGFVPPSTDSNGMQTEIRRGALQVMDASMVCDLRNILSIRRAFQLVPTSPHTVTERHVFDNGPNHGEEVSQDDIDDEGGEEGLNRSANKPVLRMRRSFELLLRDGRVVRFEARSCQLAVEWIDGLRALVAYWKQRHRFDAEQEMGIAQASRPRLTPQIRICREHEVPPDAPPDLSASLPALISIYNWCVIKGCRCIRRGGKLFMRKGLWGQYKLVQMFLVTNHLVHYRIRPHSLLHFNKRRISLSNAYVCSGYMAALTLPGGQFDPTKPSYPRHYHDGLETDDQEEDTIFIVYYRSPSQRSAGHFYDVDANARVPEMSEKRKTLVFRTRSKLERDAWCWAINCEIEKTVRAEQAREDTIRENGNLIP